MVLFVYADASIEPQNPGGWGVGGYVIKNPEGKILVKGTYNCGQYPELTNNVAEYSAIKGALEKLIELGWTNNPLLVMSDSQLVIRQLREEYNCNSVSLKKCKNEVDQLVKSFSSGVSFMWIPREKNKEADEVSRSLYPKLKEEK